MCKTSRQSSFPQRACVSAVVHEFPVRIIACMNTWASAGRSTEGSVVCPQIIPSASDKATRAILGEACAGTGDRLQLGDSCRWAGCLLQTLQDDSRTMVRHIRSTLLPYFMMQIVLNFISHLRVRKAVCPVQCTSCHSLSVNCLGCTCEKKGYTRCRSAKLLQM